jgi:hypothetical protein
MNRVGCVVCGMVVAAVGLTAAQDVRGAVVEIASTGSAYAGGGAGAGGIEFNNTFTANTNLSVTELGVWDQGGDGLNIAHRAEVWDVTTQSLLGSVSIPAGTTAPLGGQSTTGTDQTSGFRFAPLGLPIALVSGHGYSLQTYDFGDTNHAGTDPYGDGGHTVTATSDITLVRTGFVFTAASGYHGDDSNVDPDFFAVGSFITAVPEPASIALIGAVALATLTRRRGRTG